MCYTHIQGWKREGERNNILCHKSFLQERKIFTSLVNVMIGQLFIVIFVE